MKNICEWKNWKEVGKYKAPAEKDNSKNFKWLCKNHIKLFNKNWNYFDGMCQNEIEDFLKSDLTWHRPTQKFGSSDNFFKQEKMANGFAVRKLSEKDKDAFRILELELNADWLIIQKKFKTLVKKFHPDRNSGSKQFEDKLKKVTLAYSHLKLIMIRK